MGLEFQGTLYLVTDRELCRSRPFFEMLDEAISGGVDLIQLREKNETSRGFFDLAKRTRDFLQPRHTPLIINDRVDIALAVGAEGVHLGQSDLPYGEARKILGRERIIGLSVENFAQAMKASETDADYLGMSPVFKTPTKPELETQWGEEGIKKLRLQTRHALIAIGGINPLNAARVVEVGADGIAVVSAICSAPNPYEAARELKMQIITGYEKRIQR